MGAREGYKREGRGSDRVSRRSQPVDDPETQRTLDRDRAPSATNNHRTAAITMPEAANRRPSGSYLSLGTLLLGCIIVMRHPPCPEPTKWLL